MNLRFLIPGLTLAFFLATSLELSAADPAADPAAVPVVFRDVTATSKIDFAHPPAPDVEYIVEAANGGVALFDYDRDGLIDIYLVSSLTAETAHDPKNARSALYENLGQGRFDDVSEESGLAWPGWGVGVCVADYDGDGWQDLYVTGLEHNRLYRNQGGENFRDVTDTAGTAGGGWSTGCAFADFDRDGDLDLFVSRYLTISLAGLPEFGEGKHCRYRDLPVHCGPRGLEGITDLFFRNEGDGTFTEISEQAGVHDPDERFGLGAVWFDADEDDWLDLFVANDTQANYLYLNQKDGTFEEMGHLMGVAVSEDGKQQGSMGIAVGDYLNEGRFSLFVTNFAEEYNALYRNEGGYFSDISFRSQTALSSLPYVGWGTTFFDYDNDGWLDLLLVNGHVYPQVADLEMKAIAPYHQRRLLYRNQRDGTFEEISDQAGGPLLERRVSRGSAVGDLDNDGRLDVVINNLVGKAEVWSNVFPAAGNWLLVRLIGAGKMTDAIGAEVSVRVGETRQTRLVQSGSSYLSQDDQRLHFGLGDAAKVDAIEVQWPDGSSSTHPGAAANQVLEIRQEPRPESSDPG